VLLGLGLLLYEFLGDLGLCYPRGLVGLNDDCLDGRKLVVDDDVVVKLFFVQLFIVAGLSLGRFGLWRLWCLLGLWSSRLCSCLLCWLFCCLRDFGGLGSCLGGGLLGCSLYSWLSRSWFRGRLSFSLGLGRLCLRLSDSRLSRSLLSGRLSFGLGLGRLRLRFGGSWLSGLLGGLCSGSSLRGLEFGLRLCCSGSLGLALAG
jgi:hypothetical protein